MTSGAMYPGVPDVSVKLSSLSFLAIPRSVKWIYPTFSHRCTFVIENKILGFDIPVYNFFLVHIFKARKNAGCKEPRLLFSKAMLLADMIP